MGSRQLRIQRREEGTVMQRPAVCRRASRSGREADQSMARGVDSIRRASETHREVWDRWAPARIENRSQRARSIRRTGQFSQSITMQSTQSSYFPCFAPAMEVSAAAFVLGRFLSRVTAALTMLGAVAGCCGDDRTLLHGRVAPNSEAVGGGADAGIDVHVGSTGDAARVGPVPP